MVSFLLNIQQALAMLFLMLLLLICKWEFQASAVSAVASAASAGDDKCNEERCHGKLERIVAMVNQCQVSGRPGKIRATLAPNAQQNSKPAKRFQICPNVVSSSAGNKCEQSQQNSGADYDMIYYHEFHLDKLLLPIDEGKQKKIAEQMAKEMANGAMLADFLSDSQAAALLLLCLDMPSEEENLDCKIQSTSGPIDEPNTDISVDSRNTKSTTKEPTTTTMKPAKEICTTQEVRVKPAVIRDRFADLESHCPDLENPENCTELVDYAVRIGCIDCINGITAEQQKYFLEALNIWISEQKDWKDLEYWLGTDLCALKAESPDRQCRITFFGAQQTIYRLEPGGFRYVTVPEDWIQERVVMLVHDCDGIGKFASAAHKEKMDMLIINASYDWEQDFTFLEQCKFGVHVLTDHYKYKKEPGKVVRGKKIWFGTIKRSREINVTPKDHTLSQQEIQAHKFKYGLSDPLRENKLIGDIVDNYARVKKWGHYIAPPDEMYGSYKEHKFVVFLEWIKDLRDNDEDLIARAELDNADVDVSIAQMEIRCPNDVVYKSARVHAFQHVSYFIGGISRNYTLILQMIAYKLDNKYYQPPFHKLLTKYRILCEKNVECLRQVHFYDHPEH